MDEYTMFLPFNWPVWTLLRWGVSTGDILTFALDLSTTLDNIILNIMRMLDGLTLTLVFCAADLGASGITVLHKSLPANLHSHFLSCLTVLDETIFSERENWIKL